MPEVPSQLTLPEVCEHLLSNEQFLSAMRLKMNEPISIRREDFDKIIDELSGLINLLIQRKMEYEMTDLIADNNNILEQIKDNVEKSSKHISLSTKHIEFTSNEDTSFTEIHNLISEEKKRMLDQLNDAEVEKSMSMIGQYDDFVSKVNELQRKVKAMEDKYETNFKSLWNVLSMTESAMFDFLKESKVRVEKEKEKQIKEAEKEKDKSVFSFWK